MVTEGERADRVTQRIVADAGGAFDEEHHDEQRTADDAACRGAFSSSRSFSQRPASFGTADR
jgi:hypothetical protein